MRQLAGRLAFGVLCLLSGSVWLLPDASPSAWPEAGAIAYSVLALCVLPLIVSRRSPHVGAPGLRVHLRVAVAAAGAIAAPLALLHVGAQGSGAALSLAALCTCPLWVALALSVLRADTLQRHLRPCLTALAGALLLLPISEPSSTRAVSSALLCLGAAALMGVSVVVCSEVMQEVGAAPAFGVGAGANAAALWIVFAYTDRPARWVSITGRTMLLQTTVEVLIAALTLGLLRAMPPLPLVTRFLWTPLIFAAEGALVLRAPLTARMVSGIVLTAWGAALLLRERPNLPDEVPSLR